MKSFYQIVLLPILVAFTLLVGYYQHMNKQIKHNVWNNERETVITFTYTFVDYYQSKDDYKILNVVRSSSQSVKPGHSYQGWWKITNIGERSITIYLRHYLYPMDYIKYVNSSTVPDQMVIHPGEQVLVAVNGYIDPSVLLQHDDQPYSRAMTNRLEVSSVDFVIRDAERRKKDHEKLYDNTNPTSDSYPVTEKVMPYKWYVNN